MFDAQSSGKFNPMGPCSAYKVPQQIASAVHKKQRHDEIGTAQLISRGITAASATKGGEGGMNPAFLSALRSHGGPGTAIRTASGTIPANVHPPANSFPQSGSSSLFAIAPAEVKPVQVRLASGAPDWSSMGAFFGNLFGSNRDNTSSNARESSGAQPVQGKVQATVIAPKAGPAQTKVTAVTQAKLETLRKDATTPPQALHPQQKGSAELPTDSGGARATNLLAGAVSTVPAGDFQNRFRRRVTCGDLGCGLLGAMSAPTTNKLR